MFTSFILKIDKDLKRSMFFIILLDKAILKKNILKDRNFKKYFILRERVIVLILNIVQR